MDDQIDKSWSGRNQDRHEDLRDLINKIDEMGELERLEGVDWNLEMGALAEMVCQTAREGRAPALLFEKTEGFPDGFRVLAGAANSMRRLAYILGFSEPASSNEVVRAYRDRMRGDFELIPPEEYERLHDSLSPAARPIRTYDERLFALCHGLAIRMQPSRNPLPATRRVPPAFAPFATRA